MTDSAGQPHGAGDTGPEKNPISAMRRIRDELDRLQDSLSEKDVRLGEREEQLNALAARLEAKGRELATLNDLINQERQKLQAKEAELRKQEGFVSRARDLEEALRNREASLTLRERAMRRTLEALKRQAREVDQQRRELRRAALRNHPAINMEVLAAPGAWRIPVAVASAVLIGVILYVAIRPTYRVQAAWERTDNGSLSIDTVRKAFLDANVAAKALSARGEPTIPADGSGTTWSTGGQRLVSFELVTREPLAASRAVNARGSASLAAIGRAEASDTAAADETVRLTQRREELRRELSQIRVPDEPAATATAPSVGSVDALLTRATELAASRQTVKTRLAAVREKLAEITTRPSGAAANVAEPLRAEAQAADPELAQARRRLKDQQETIRSLLGDAFAAAEPAVGEARRSLDELFTSTNSYRQNPPDAEAAGELDAIRDEAAKAKDRLDGLAKSWSAARAGLKPAADPVAAQQAIEANVKEYIAASAAETASLERRIQALGEAGSQITKRLVVRAALMKSLRRVTEAHRALVGRIDNVTVASNFRLEAAVQTAAGAAETANARIAVIDAGLRDRFASRAKQDRQRQLDELRQEEQALTAKTAELTDSLVPAQEALQELTRRWVGSLAQMGRRQEAERRRNRVRDELARIDDRLTALREAAAGRVIPMRFIAASYSPQPANRTVRLGWSLGVAFVALAVGLILVNPVLMSRVRSAVTVAVGVIRRRKAESAETSTVAEPNGQTARPSASSGTGPAEKK